jgi:hypothetical protein
MSAVEIARGDTITVLRARGRRLAKLIRDDGTIDSYDSARLFDLVSLPVAGLNVLAQLLEILEQRPDCCIVRGAIAAPLRTRGVRRLLHFDPATGDAPTLCEVPRRWVALDIDRVPRPASIAPTDLQGCATVAIEALPAAFRVARYIVQATAGHGIKPGLRLRLWFWLDRPTTGIELKRWLRAAPVDHSIFGAAQIIYTAAPLFVAGVPDPLTERLIMMTGAVAEVAVPSSSALAPAVRRTPPGIDAIGASRYGTAALMSATARVARAGEGSRHPTLLAEALGLAPLVQRGLLTASTVSRALSGAAEMVGLPATEAAAAIAWALTHPRGGVLREMR